LDSAARERFLISRTSFAAIAHPVSAVARLRRRPPSRTPSVKAEIIRESALE
jgi:hypothetical protein